MASEKSTTLSVPVWSWLAELPNLGGLDRLRGVRRHTETSPPLIIRNMAITWASNTARPPVNLPTSLELGSTTMDSHYPLKILTSHSPYRQYYYLIHDAAMGNKTSNWLERGACVFHDVLLTG